MAAARPSSRSISQNVNLSKPLLNTLNAPRPMRILGSGLRTHDGRPALVGSRHDSDGHFRWAIVECFQPLAKNPNEFGARNLDSSHDQRSHVQNGVGNIRTFSLSNLEHWNSLVTRDWPHEGERILRATRRRLAEYNRWPALAWVPRSQIPRRCFVCTGCAKVQWSGTANYGIRLPDYQHPRTLDRQ